MLRTRPARWTWPRPWSPREARAHSHADDVSKRACRATGRLCFSGGTGQVANTAEVTREQLAGGIRAMGVRPGDLLLVHSSLSSFGRMAGGAEAAARALVDAVRPDGTAFVPVFYWGDEPFEPETTPSHVGAITEAFRKLPGARRSLCPSHSVCGIGPAAAEMFAGHDRAHPFGEGSPLWRLLERNCHVLLIGCDHRSSSMIHVAEEKEGVRYLDRQRTVLVRTEDGARQVTLRRPGCSRGFGAVDAPMRAAGMISESAVGPSRLLLMKAHDLVETARAILKEDPAGLLCGLDDCEGCREARRMIGEA